MARRESSPGDLLQGKPVSPRLRRREIIGLFFGGILLTALVLTSFALVRNQREQQRDELRGRFLTRASLGASFVTQYVDDLAQRESARATRDLSEPTDRAGAFQQMTDAFEFDAAVLLDATGHVREVWPPNEGLLGKALSDRYHHLKVAVDGGIGVSNVVPSAAKGIPVVAVAVPFDSATGRQVFSGAFTAKGTPLGNYFDAAVPVLGGRAYLVDSSGQFIVSGQSPTTKSGTNPELKPEQLALIHLGSGSITIAGTTLAYARAEVTGTPWEVVLTTRASSLYGPIDKGKWESALLLLALAVGSLAGFLLLVRLVKARGAAAAAASAQGQQAMMLRSVISHNQSLIAVKDIEGRYLLINEAFERAFAVDEADLVGKTDQFLDADLAPVWRSNDERARDGLYQVEEWSDAADGRHTYEASKFPLYSSDGTLYATCGVSLDVTERRRLVEATEAARDAALVAAATQRNFAASASHELRTPTTSIIGYLEEVLDAGNLCDEDRDFLGVVYRNAQRLNHLIDDLLILGEVEIGASMMHAEPTDLMAIIDAVKSTFKAPAQQAGVNLMIVDEPNLPLAYIDPNRTEQAISNLVSNALKFTPAGGTVWLTVRACPAEQNSGRQSEPALEVIVADTGVGIEPSELIHIFDRFYRTRMALDLAVQGTGLGLPIANAMIEAQGGHITVTSTTGEGSTFTVTLPAVARIAATV